MITFISVKCLYDGKNNFGFISGMCFITTRQNGCSGIYGTPPCCTSVHSHFSSFSHQFILTSIRSHIIRSHYQKVKGDPQGPSSGEKLTRVGSLHHEI